MSIDLSFTYNIMLMVKSNEKLRQMLELILKGYLNNLPNNIDYFYR